MVTSNRIQKKIIFILASDSNTNNNKRIEEFVSNGYEVEVYAFNRGVEPKNLPKSVNVNRIGVFSNDLPYISRIKILLRGIKYVLHKTRNQDVIYYLVRQDVAMVYSFISRKPYIYEEADMTHVTFSNKYVRALFEKIDLRIIKRSIVSVFRSGGFVEYHFGDTVPSNVFVIPNRLDPSIQIIEPKEKRKFDENNIHFGFVGVIRYDTIRKISQIILSNFPKHEVHFYGTFGSEKEEKIFSCLMQYKNCIFHGQFKSPEDLPEIYSNIDVLLSTYDLSAVNHKYAEPNKYYESIYFATPIIVTEGGYLSRNVNKLGVGFSIDISNEGNVKEFIGSLSKLVFEEKVKAAKSIDKTYCINQNDSFFSLLASKI